jgi:hypothetical protein
MNRWLLIREMSMKFKPEVDEAREFLEISSDFGDPREIIREAISNSFDANAHTISISAFIDKSSGEDELVVTFQDDGEGIGEEELKLFFGLGKTNRQRLDELGRKCTAAIGEKGHGTKIYFNSKRIEVETIKNGMLIKAHLDNPKKSLRNRIVPDVDYEKSDTTSQSGTKIIVRGYNDNNQQGFSHQELKDYIFWSTKFGSFERELKATKNDNVALWLSGIGWKEGVGEPLKFGHPFLKENTDIRTLRTLDKVSPLDFYVARWVFQDKPVIGMPSVMLDFIFYIEGDKAKRSYNKMIHEAWTSWQDGQYTVADRYGLWLCKDFIPIERRDANSWISQKSEWTKYHAFANCQDFRLTANRGDVGNTPPRILEAVKTTIKDIFEKEIKTDAKWLKYQDELDKEQMYQTAQKEEKDFERRKKATLAKKTAKLGQVELFEPRQESGVFSLVLQLLTVQPDLFGFEVVDYDTAIGYDLLVTRDTVLDLNRASLMFAEIKYELQRDFNHSFKKLATVICWDTKLSNEDEVTDLTNAKRTMKITPPNKNIEKSYTKYMLVSDTEPHNIEVFVLKDFLKEKLGLEFKPRTAEE